VSNVRGDDMGDLELDDLRNLCNIAFIPEIYTFNNKFSILLNYFTVSFIHSFLKLCIRFSQICLVLKSILPHFWSYFGGRSNLLTCLV
jgi:hypothetical protein